MHDHAVLWRRLDTPGHDACRLLALHDGWLLEGTAVFRDRGVPAQLAYRLDADAVWRSRSGAVRGWIGGTMVDVAIIRLDSGDWRLNGRAVAGLQHCENLDLGFTPATNLFQVRRAALSVGEASEVPVAWFDVSSGTLESLYQRYERHTNEMYGYEAPLFRYAAELEVSAIGFVEHYPGLWQREE